MSSEEPGPRLESFRQDWKTRGEQNKCARDRMLARSSFLFCNRLFRRGDVKTPLLGRNPEKKGSALTSWNVTLVNPPWSPSAHPPKSAVLQKVANLVHLLRASHSGITRGFCLFLFPLQFFPTQPHWFPRPVHIPKQLGSRHQASPETSMD